MQITLQENWTSSALGWAICTLVFCVAALAGCGRKKEQGKGLLIIYRNVPVAITRSPEQTSTTQTYVRAFPEDPDDDPDPELPTLIAACPMCHRPFDVDQSMKEEQKKDGEQKENETKSEIKKEDKKQPVNMVAANQKKESDNQSKTRYVRRKKEKKEEKEENENYV
ncbi:unnamed protein product, partial [Mesorhabditis spiculigera]